jgi:cyclase
MKFAAILLTGVVIAGAACAQAPDFSKVQIKATDLGHGITELEGQGGNMTVAVGSDGIILIDTEFAPLHDKIKAAIAAISPLPVKYVINTHYHGDHTGGDEAFGKEGVTIVSTANLANRLANPPPGNNGQPGRPAPKAGMPTQTYTGQGTEVRIPGQTAELVHLENAHTDGDTVVFFNAANVIATGDIVGSAAYPNIDVAVGGGIDGMIAGADFVIAHSDDKTKIIPGHGAIMNRKDVIAYRKMLATARERIAKAKKKGMTEQQVMDAHLLTDLDKRWAAPGNALAERFPINVYRSIK